MKTFCPQVPAVVTCYNTEHIQRQGEAYRSSICCTLFIVITFLLFTPDVRAQFCNPGVPTYTVNLTGSPNGSWVSPVVQRADNCCGSLPPDNCVQFIVTLDPQSQGIIFDIFSGAIPPGALYYQVNCNPPTPVGQPLCLTGVGPHYVTFCKPGNNNNEYIIRSIGMPGVGPGPTINDGCTDTMYCFGYDESTLVWNSIYPGTPGMFNNLLSCSVACDTTFVSGGPNLPSYVDYQVCGLSLSGCDTIQVCDTVRVYINTVLSAYITPQNPTICFGSPGTWISVVVSGGANSYSYLWSNGATTASVFVTSAGTYSVLVSDSTDCPNTIASIVVTAFGAPITANAGPDINVCTTNLPVQLNGAITGAPTCIWTGGNGVFSPSNTTPNAVYNPTAAEVLNGSVTLQLTTTGNGTCPGDSDQVTVFFRSFSATVSSTTTNVLCNGGNNGSCALTLTGGNAPFSFTWSTVPVQTGSTVSGLGAGSYSVIITDMYGCTGTNSTVITEPLPLVLTSAGFPASCIGSCNGQATSIPSGGAGGFSYAWTPVGGTTALATGLCAGIYTITITDQNGCTRTDTAIVSQPAAPPAVLFSVNDTSGCENMCVQFTNNSPGAVSCYWTFGDNTTSTQTNPQHCYASAGQFTVTLTITDTYGCTNSLASPAMITVYNNPMADFTMGPQPTTILDPDICFTDRSTSDVVTWYWNFDDPNDPSGSAQQSPCHTYSDTGTFCASLIVHNTHGCWSTITYCLRIQPYYTLYVPNAFTPNGDGTNDVFLPLGTTLDESSFEMKIFDRWGKLIFTSKSWGQGWDGKVAGGQQVVQIGVYVWKINVKDYTGALHDLTGHVSVIK